MNRPDPLVAEQVNWAQYAPGQEQGHYESFYLRGNDPIRPLAFWLRYTIFAPHRRPADAVGELWAVVFDGETRTHTTAKVELPIAECLFSPSTFDIKVGGATLDATRARGQAGEIGWDLTYRGSEPPLYLLPERLYRGGFPKAKSLVSLPMAEFAGELSVGGRVITVNGWTGSQNHNWGSRHTDRYAFGQVAGFDNAPESFLEVATARNRIGPLWMRPVTLLVLRHGGHEYALTSLRTGLRAKAKLVGGSNWTFTCRQGPIVVVGHIDAPPDAFVLLEYPNPPGGVKYCLNTKLARCEVSIANRATAQHETLTSTHGALFEILDDIDPRTR